MNSWEEIKIGDLGRVVTGKTPPTEEVKYFNGEHSFVSPKDMDFDSRHITSTLTTITKLALEKFKNQVIPRNTVMFTALSYGFGKIGLANNTCLTNQQINSIIVDDKRYDYNFVYYLLRFSKSYIFSYNAGIVTPIIPKSIFEKIKVQVPKSIITQRKIASILSAYDDMIENNLKRIKLLEELAQRTYEEWFVKFRVKSVELKVDRETGLPEGWENVPMTEIAEFLNGFAFKPTDWSDLGLPIIKIKELKAGISNETPRNDGTRVPKKFLVKSGDILFSWSGSLEVVIWQGEDGWLNQHLFLVRPKNNIPRDFVHQALLSALNEFNSLTTGATMKHIKRKELDFVKVSKPTQSILIQFEAFVKPVQDQILALSKQNRLLKEARDILLPRLMSGEIKV